MGLFLSCRATQRRMRPEPLLANAIPSGTSCRNGSPLEYPSVCFRTLRQNVNVPQQLAASQGRKSLEWVAFRCPATEILPGRRQPKDVVPEGRRLAALS